MEYPIVGPFVVNLGESITRTCIYMCILGPGWVVCLYLSDCQQACSNRVFGTPRLINQRFHVPFPGL